MRSLHHRLGAGGLLVVAGLVAAVAVAPMLVAGADHLDAPTVKTDKRIDITDIYAFRSSAGRTTLVLNVNPLLSPASTKASQFRPSALYELKLDTNGDAFADIAYRVRFGNPRTLADGAVDQTFQVRRAIGAAARRTEWSGVVVANGKTTPVGRSTRTAYLSGGGAAFAGPRDDPFFFDLPGFVEFKKQLLGGSTDLGVLLGGFTGMDTFAGTNISSIVLNLPNSRIGGTGRTIGYWGTTAIRQSGQWVQVERMARPAINTVFNHSNAEKEAANRLSPNDDRAVDRENVLGVLDAIGDVLDANMLDRYDPATEGAIADLLLPDILTLKLGDVLDANALDRYDPATEGAIADLLLPDILTLKLGDASGFLNGRRLADDVIDAEFGVLTNGNVTSDGVNANDKAFSGAFPYLAAPHN